APELTNHEEIRKYILNRINIADMFIAKGVVDAVDRSTPKVAIGGKLGLDSTGDEVKGLGITLLEDDELLQKMQNSSNEGKGLKQ
ncbi:menaquinone biosynthesis decarboxylase, partial [Aliarcobacter butzleri]